MENANISLDISVVIPLHNEEEAVAKLHEELVAELQKLGKSYEIIYVDDGSRDNTLTNLRAVTQNCAAVTIISLRRNFGQTAAMAAGMDAAKGAVIITMDGDLQNDPSGIPLLLAEMDKGYDLVSGWRKERKDRFLTRRLPSMIANKIISRHTGVRLHDYGCSLKAYKADVVKNIRLYGEMHRFIPAVASVYGVKISEVPVKHRPRTTGHTKYGLSRTFRVLLDLMLVRFLLGYSTKPIHFFGGLGFFTLFLAFLTLSTSIVLKINYNWDMTNNPLLLLSALLSILSVQSIALGILAEMNARIYYESTGKPTYAVRRVYHLDD